MPAPHDLLHLGDDEVATLADAAPGWVKSALARAPYVVVRRERAAPGMVAVGVRGSSRGERFGTWLRARIGSVPVTPVALAQAGAWRAAPFRNRVPALGALDAAAKWLAQTGWKWGPGGSVGFELAAGQPTATASSDLDIVVYSPERMTKCQAGEMVRALAGLGCPIDVILETPGGGVALVDYAGSSGKIHQRTPRGSILVTDPWTVPALAPVST